MSYAEFAQVAVQLIIWAEREAVLQGQGAGFREESERGHEESVDGVDRLVVPDDEADKELGQEEGEE